jgi:hypothetical protein
VGGQQRLDWNMYFEPNPLQKAKDAASKNRTVFTQVSFSRDSPVKIRFRMCNHSHSLTAHHSRAGSVLARNILFIICVRHNNATLHRRHRLFFTTTTTTADISDAA